jgi:nucleotide-binding universal stress UspA family protein
MRILIASNSTKHASSALESGILLAKKTKAKLGVVHVAPKMNDRQRGKDHLATVAERLAEVGLEAKPFLRVGYPAEQIVHLANEEGFDLVVLGEGSPESLLRRVLAPTAERVIANAPCPVLIARGELTAADHFLICHSGQQGLDTLKRFLKHNAKLINKKSTVTLLHVMSQIGAGYRVSDWQLQAEAAEMIKEHTLEGEWLAEGLADLKNETKVEAVPKVRHGLVVEEILDEVRMGEYDIVVLGAHRRGGWGDILVDDIAKQVIARVKGPVLVVNSG